MLDVYLLTLGLAAGICLTAMLGLTALSRTARVAGLFQEARGASERPRWGGAAIFIAFAVTPFVASAISSEAAELFSPKSGKFLALLAACGLIFVVGFLDDWKMLSWRPRLLAQVAAASAVYSAGYEIDKVGLPWGPEFSLGIMAPVVTVFWVVAFTNALNMIDGRDGIAGGVGILAATTLAVVAADSAHPTVALLLIALAGAGLGFLPFNLPPASVYLGDSGATLIGFILGALSIRAATGFSEAIFVAVPLVALAYPVLDISLAVVRRSLNGRHPLLGDKEHIHDRLEETGFGPRGLLLVIYAVAALFAGGALVLHFVHVIALEMAVLVGMTVIVGTILTRLGYVLTFWNSASIVWLRRRLRWLEQPTVGGLEDRQD